MAATLLSRTDDMADPGDNNHGGRRNAMIALLVVVVLFVVGWVLAHELYANGQLEDCLLSGRTNCAPNQGSQSVGSTRLTGARHDVRAESNRLPHDPARERTPGPATELS
jgi:hypothetical protein